MMYGCSIDQRVILPRPCAATSGTGRSAGKAVVLHDDIARAQLPQVRRVARHADHTFERPRLTPVYVHDVRVATGPVKHCPHRTRRRDLDHIVPVELARKLQVYRAPGTVYECDAFTGHGLQRLRLQPVGLDDDLQPSPGGSRGRRDTGDGDSKRREPSKIHRYSSSTACIVSDCPRRHTVTATASPIRWRSSDSWRWWRSFTGRPSTAMMMSPFCTPA